MTAAAVTRSSVTLLALVCVACGWGRGPRAVDRDAEAPLILEQVLRCEVRQFVPQDEPSSSIVCLAVRDGTRVVDPATALPRALAGGPQPRPESRCEGSDAIRLVAGPIEWLTESEVRVAGSYRRGDRISVSVSYRVVREDSGWECLGPVLSYDPN